MEVQADQEVQTVEAQAAQEDLAVEVQAAQEVQEGIINYYHTNWKRL